MNSLLRSLGVGVALTLLAHPAAAPGQGAPGAGARVHAFVGVNVVPMDRERILRDQTVVVRGDRIVSMAPRSAARIPAGAVRIDGTGKFLMPGLAEMHGHIPPPNSSSQPVEDVLFLFVANGVTTVRGMQGAPGQLDLKRAVARGEMVGPTLYLAGPGFSGGSIDSPEQAAERVRQQKREGWDLLKVLPGLTRAEYDAMAAEARRLRIPFAGHVPSDVGVPRALAAGQRTIDHLDGYIEHLGGDRGPLDAAKVAELVRQTRDARTAVIPTMPLWDVIMGSASLDSLRAYPELRYMPPAVVEGWTRGYERRVGDAGFDRERARRIARNRIDLLRAFHRGGATILFGTDAPQQFSVPGFSIHREFPHMRAAGMTPFEILASASRDVGAHFAAADRFGTVQPGSRADLVLLDGDPLRDLGNVRRVAGVMAAGRWLPRAEIDRRLERIAAAGRAAAAGAR